MRHVGKTYELCVLLSSTQTVRLQAGLRNSLGFHPQEAVPMALSTKQHVFKQICLFHFPRSSQSSVRLCYRERTVTSQETDAHCLKANSMTPENHEVQPTVFNSSIRPWHYLLPSEWLATKMLPVLVPITNSSVTGWDENVVASFVT